MGWRPRERHDILKRCFSFSIPSKFSESYKAEWGQPETKDRMSKMTAFLKGQINGALARKEQDLRQAIEDWNADLRWLRTEYEEYAFWLTSYKVSVDSDIVRKNDCVLRRVPNSQWLRANTEWRKDRSNGPDC